MLVFGGIAWTPVVFLLGNFVHLNQISVLFSIAAGATFAIACIGHYNAFAKGPVRLVAPLIGVYPVISFGIAAAAGSTIGAFQWLAVLALVGGIALISRKQDTDSEIYELPAVVGWCMMATLGFAATFALGQHASAEGTPLISGLITRVTTIMLVAIVFFGVIARQKNVFAWPSGRQISVLALMGIFDAVALGVVIAAGVLPHAEYASAASSIFGLVTVLLAWVFLKERIGSVQWAGVLVIFSSIAYLASA